MRKPTLQLRFVKDTPSGEPSEPIKLPPPERVAQVTQEAIMFLALTYVGIKAAEAVIDTTSQVILITANAKIN